MLVVAAVSLMLCLRLFSLFVSRYRSKLSGFFFFCLFFFVFFFLFFFFSLPLSLYPPFSFFLSLSSPSLLTFPTTFFFYYFFLFIYLFYFYFIFFPFLLLLSLSCFLCPLVLSVTVWLSKRVYKIKLIN